MTTKRILTYFLTGATAVASWGQTNALDNGENPPELEPMEARGASHSGILPGDDVHVPGILSGARSLHEIPRSISWVPETMVSDFSIDALEELFPFSPGMVETAQFGHTTLPVIRGDMAELYTNGQRRSNNQFGFKPSLNAVDSALLVRGPAGPVFGPGFHSGGYVHFQTKLPGLNRDRNAIQLQAGGLALDGAGWTDLTFRADLSRVLNPGRSGFRISYEAQGNETHLDSPAAADDSHSLYAAWMRSTAGGWDMKLMGEFLWQNAPQLLGVNRPSNVLTTEDRYIRGSAAFRDFGSGPVFVIEPPDIGPVRSALDRGASLLAEEDRSNARAGWVQFILEKDGPIAFSNRTFVEGVDRERAHGFEYFEYVEQLTVENRSEWKFNGTITTGEWEAVAGGVIRYEQRESYVNFFNEIPFAYDLTRPSMDYSVRREYPGVVVPGIPGPDGLEFFGLPFSPETTDSTLWNPALFVESSLRFDSRWEVMAGLRLDGYLAEAADPITPDGAVDTDSTGAWSGTFSLLYKPREGERFYLNVSDGNAVEGSIAGGGIMLNADGIVNRDNLENRSRLFELGWKKQLNTVATVGISAYHQTRKRIEIRGPRSDLEVRGLEAEARLDFGEAGYGYINAAWTLGDYRDSAPSQLGGRSLYDLYAPGTGPEQAGTGVGYDFFFLNQVPAGDYRIPGLSRFTASAGWHREAIVPGWPGFRLWAEYQGGQPGNLDAEYWIPERLVLNAGLQYSRDWWEVSVDWLNLTEESYWLHNGQTFFNNQLISRGLPARLEARIRFRF